MAAYRPVEPLTVYFSNTGEVLAGGELHFFETLTENPKSVYSDEALSVNLGNEVTLDSAGRAPSDIWVSGDVRVRLYDADGALQDEADPVTEQGGAAASIPSQSGNSGKFLTTNGTSMSWDAVEQLPDQTGHANKILTTDGANASWIAKPADGADAGITVDEVDKEFIAGVASDDTKFIVLSGTSSADASGGRETTKAIVFATAFDTIQHVSVTITGDGITAYNDCPRLQITSQTVTGFTVRFNTGENSTAAGWDITAPVPFSWIAFGTREIP